jgi:hypothetical protein
VSVRSLLAYSAGNAGGIALVALVWLAQGPASAARTALWYLVGGLLANMLFAWLTWRGKL